MFYQASNQFDHLQLLHFRLKRLIFDKKYETKYTFNPQAPGAQKIADEVVFRRFQGEGVKFFCDSDLTDPLSDF